MFKKGIGEIREWATDISNNLSNTDKSKKNVQQQWWKTKITLL
jgi:hypothetical protein